MPVPPAARLLVLRGASNQAYRFSAGRPACLRAGSGAGASLVLDAPGIAPHQFDAIWDGTHLWLQDALRLGRTLVNGRPLNHWVAILGQAIVSCAQVRIWMAGSGPQPTFSAPDFSALERARITPSYGNRRRARPTERLISPVYPIDQGPGE
jgi:hypothetical protein